MEYRHAPREDHRDLASGAVLHSRPGVPAFPVRVARELFGRARAHLGSDPGPLTLWDPCCGSAQLLVTLGLTERPHLRRLVGSDIDEDALDLARANARLLTVAGLEQRGADLREAAARHGRSSHDDDADSAVRLASDLRRDGGDLPVAIHRANVLDPTAVGCMAADAEPDIVLADLPHGQLTAWEHTPPDVAPIEQLSATLGQVLAPDTVVVLVARSRRAPLPAGTRALERLRICHRAAAITRADWLR